MPWTRQTPFQINELFASQRGADPVGLRLHLFFGCAYLFLAAWPTTFVDWSALCLLVCWAIRMISHHRILGPLWWDGLARLGILWTLWLALSLLWTAGTRRDWLFDIGSIRYALAIPLLYPIIDRRVWLIGALALGFVCAEFSQLIHFIGLHSGIRSMTWQRDPARISGWFDPVVAGSLLCAALGLFGGLAMAKVGRVRVVAAILVGTTLLAILATGTRGAWIAAAALIGFLLLVHLIRNGAARGFSRTRLVLFIIGTVGVVGTGLMFAPGAARTRFDKGVAEVTNAMRRGDYTSDTGQRLSMWMWAMRCIRQSPIIGVGAGGYKPWCEEQLRIERGSVALDGAGLVPLLPAPHAHAHSWFLHGAATLGLVGFGLLLAMIVLAIRSIVNRPPSDGLAVPLALFGLTLAGLFDTIHVNQQTANLFYILLALSVTMRPGEPELSGAPRATS